MKKLPCGMAWKLPRFCKDKKCSECVLNKETEKKEAEQALKGGAE